MRKKWIAASYDEKTAAELSERLGISPIVARLLVVRNIRKEGEARAFLYPETEQESYDPFLLPDMEAAVERIRRAIRSGEKITVWGDYDVDGVTATAMLVRTLRALGAKEVAYYIPSRSEGYGLRLEALERIAGDGTSLVVTVDCGVSNIAEAEAMRGRLDLIVTDHHLPGKRIPAALAVVNAHRRDSSYPFSGLCGAGVSLKLAEALTEGSLPEGLFELAALGTVADIVPLLSENRKIVRLGMAAMETTSVAGLRALISAAGLSGKKITASDIGFGLAPRLNAAGRLRTADDGERLLLTYDEAEAVSLASALSKLNAERQTLEMNILEEARQELSGIDMEAARVAVVSGEGWHPGVIGIVASRLVEEFYRPTVVIGTEGGTGRGSCRSIKGFHMFAALSQNAGLFKEFGGHEMAAGLTIDAEKIDTLRERLDEFAREHLTAEDYIPQMIVDASLSPGALTMDLTEEISRIEPFGMGNPRPVFIAENIESTDVRQMGRDGKHLSFRTGKDRSSPRAVGWNMGSLAGEAAGGEIDIAYTPEVNEWNGTISIQCKLKDLRRSPVIKKYAPDDFPTRQTLANIYIVLRSLQKAGPLTPDDGVLAKRCGVSPAVFSTGMKVFTEIGLAYREGGSGRYVLPPPPRQKLDLMDSDTWRDGQTG